jgi:hypothetical protein
LIRLAALGLKRNSHEIDAGFADGMEYYDAFRTLPSPQHVRPRTGRLSCSAAHWPLFVDNYLDTILAGFYCITDDAVMQRNHRRRSRRTGFYFALLMMIDEYSRDSASDAVISRAMTAARFLLQLWRADTLRADARVLPSFVH